MIDDRPKMPKPTPMRLPIIGPGKYEEGFAISVGGVMRYFPTAAEAEAWGRDCREAGCVVAGGRPIG